MPALKKPATRYVILSLVGLILIGGASVTSASKNVYRDLRTYNQILANVYDKYVEEMDSKDLIRSSIEGLIDGRCWVCSGIGISGTAARCYSQDMPWYSLGNS